MNMTKARSLDTVHHKSQNIYQSVVGISSVRHRHHFQWALAIQGKKKKKKKDFAILIIFGDLAEARLTGYQLHTLHPKP